MTASSGPAIAVLPLGPMLVAVVPWAHQRPVGPARFFLTVVAKVTLTRVHRGDCRIVTPEPLGDADRAPLLPRGEVTLHGSSPAVGSNVLVHLRVSRDGREIQTRRASLDVVGSIAELAPLGPRAPDAPERIALLRGGSPPPTDNGVVIVPSSVDAAYFQTAPLDQRFDGLRGDELIEIEGLGEPAATKGFRLPGLRANAYVYHLAAQPMQVALAVDTVRVELPAERVTVLMRGNCAVGSREAFDGLGVAARLESPVTGPAFPPSLGRGQKPSRPSASMTVQLVQTAQLDQPVVAHSPLPFDASAARAPAGPQPARTVRVTAVDDAPISSAPVTLAPHTTRIEGAVTPAPLPFKAAGAEPAPKSRRGTRTKTKPEGESGPTSSKGERAAAAGGKGPTSARGPRTAQQPAPPARIEPPAFVGSPFVAQPPAPARAAPQVLPVTEPPRHPMAGHVSHAVAPPQFQPVPDAGDDQDVSPPTKRESQLPPAPVGSPPPATAAAPAAVAAPADPRGRGLLARGRGADFLRALRAVDDERGT